MSKFKVWDRVRVKKPLDTYRGPSWIESMDHLDSLVLEVEAPFYECGGMMCFSSGEWFIADDWAEIVSPAADPTTLTRRDHFAMAALTGFCGNLIPQSEAQISQLVECAFMLAAEMEAARNKED